MTIRSLIAIKFCTKIDKIVVMRLVHYHEFTERMKFNWKVWGSEGLGMGRERDHGDPSNFKLTLAEAKPPNLIPANISGYMVACLIGLMRISLGEMGL